MAVLDELAEKYDDIEKSEEASDSTESKAKVKPTEPTLEPSESAKGRVEGLLKLCEAGVQSFVDPRLALSEEDIHAGRESMAPAVEKYGLAGSGEGEGAIPFSEEVTLGFYLGGLFKRTMNSIRQLRAFDKAEEKKRRAQQNGSEREHRPTEQAHDVSGAKRDGQKSDAEEEGWNSESF